MIVTFRWEGVENAIIDIRTGSIVCLGGKSYFIGLFRRVDVWTYHIVNHDVNHQIHSSRVQRFGEGQQVRRRPKLGVNSISGERQVSQRFPVLKTWVIGNIYLRILLPVSMIRFTVLSIP